MSQEQQSIITELLKRIEESRDMGDMGFTTSKELISIVRMLQVA